MHCWPSHGAFWPAPQLPVKRSPRPTALRGTLHVGAEQCIGVIYVPALLARFRAAYPGVEIQLRQCGSMLLLEELQAGRLDVAFVATSGRMAENVELLPLATEPMVLVCHPDHRLAKRREI